VCLLIETLRGTEVTLAEVPSSSVPRAPVKAEAAAAFVVPTFLFLWVKRQ